MSVMEPTIRRPFAVRPSANANPVPATPSTRLPHILAVRCDLTDLATRLAGEFSVVDVSDLDDVDAIREATPVAVFYDLKLHETPLDVVRSIRRRFQCPIFFTSAYRDPRTVADAFRAGAVDVYGDTLSGGEVEHKVRSAARSYVETRHRQLARNDIRLRIDSLSVREREVLDLLAEGLSIKQIASRCQISFQTAAKHRANVLRKMRAENDVKLVHLLRQLEA